jgi:hypothetical protein
MQDGAVQLDVEWVYGPMMPDVIQIWIVYPAGSTSPDSGYLVAEKDTDNNFHDTSELVDAPPGSKIDVWVCPRLKVDDVVTNTMPDESRQDQPWERFSILIPNVTTPGKPPEKPPDLPAPVIVVADVRDNLIRIDWKAPRPYPVYHVFWGTSSVVLQQVDVDSGSDYASREFGDLWPQTEYWFKVQGVVPHPSGDETSPWSQIVKMTTDPPTHSLRKFLLKKGINPSGKKLSDLEPAGQTLRKWMGL